MPLPWKQGTILLSLAWLSGLSKGASYDLLKEYSGPTFFNDWNFYDNYDNLTNGDAIFISAAEAGSTTSLAYVDPSTNHAIMRVDNTSTVPWNEKRKTVRITTKDAFDIGSVFVVDINHAPYGCSVWPAWWSWAAAEQWPEGGEIDIFEGINQVSRSQMGLHTPPGCSQVSPTQLTTRVRSTDCAGDRNAGCIVENTNPASYGAAFAAAGGGVFVTEFAGSGISIWFFPRADIPGSLTATSKSIDTATLGTPMGHWPATGCDISRFFKPQNLVFKITLCGDFARPPEIFNQTCEGRCYEDFVIGQPSYYSNAYFDVSYVKVFSNDTSKPTNSVSQSASSTSVSGPGASQSSAPGGALGSQIPGLALCLCALFAAVGLSLI